MDHYNTILQKPWQDLGYNVVYQPCCYRQAFNVEKQDWPIQFPEVNWTDDTLVIMHCQDFLTMDGNRSCEIEKIQQHFGSRSNQVAVVHWNIDIGKIHNTPLNLVYFPTHSYEFLQRVAAIQDLWQSGLTVKRTHAWQCLNGVPRPHRRLAVSALRTLPNGIISFANDIPLPQWDYSSYRGTENEDNFVRLNYVYGDCDINVVTETIYDYAPGIISEKTIMAWLALQVPLVIGYQGIVEHCESLGFDMFRDIVDCAYDQMDNESRLTQAFKLNWDLLNNGIDRNNIMDRLLANQQHALTTWPTQLIKNYNQQVIELQNR
jgi:hypothetical protein